MGYCLHYFLCLVEPCAHLLRGKVADAVAVDELQLRRLFQRGLLFRVAVLADEVDPALRQPPLYLDGDIAAGGDVSGLLRAIGEVGLKQQKIRLFGSTLPDHIVEVVG